MNAVQCVKWAVLAKRAEFLGETPPEYPCKDVDSIYDELDGDDSLIDAKSEVRCGEVRTGLKCPYSRHYESEAVAIKMPDGRWVGWTYWYGGGKHGCPEEIDWMSDAYFLDCTEEEKLVTVRTFKVAEPVPA